MKTIGIIGGGQLGMMIAQAAKQFGARVVAMDLTPDAPASHYVDELVIADSFSDEEALEMLCSKADVITYEFENIPAPVLEPLAQKYNIKQGIRQLFDSQDRLTEKLNAQRGGLSCGEFMKVDTLEELHEGIERMGYPCILKSRRLGYDGHGQKFITSEADLSEAEKMLTVPMILEKVIDFAFEASVIVVADRDNAVCFPVGENRHKHSILDLSIVPAPELSEQTAQRMKQMSIRFMRECGYEGILAIEYFVLRDGTVLFNEMAPRPHNSGHYSIEGCSESQYTALCRYLLDMPLEEPRLLHPTIMKNILGENYLQALEMEKCQEDNVYVHMYHKTESRPKRKMGHITFTHITPDEYQRVWAHKFI